MCMYVCVCVCVCVLCMFVCVVGVRKELLPKIFALPPTKILEVNIVSLIL